MSELDALAEELAYAGAVSTISSYCGWGEKDARNFGVWFDLAGAKADPSFTSEHQEDLVDKAARYLELRGLLVRHPENPGKVRWLPRQASTPAG